MKDRGGVHGRLPFQLVVGLGLRQLGDHLGRLLAEADDFAQAVRVEALGVPPRPVAILIGPLQPARNQA